MDLDEIKRGLRAEIKKRENEQYFTFQCNVRQMCKDVLAKLEEMEAENAELKQKLEDAQASAYAESVDAGMENRRLKRALWLARANKAESEARGWYHSNAYIIKYDGLHNIKGVLYGKGFKRYPEEWMKLWIKIEKLCLAKAEEYK